MNLRQTLFAIAVCPLFPPDNVWNTPVDRLPRHASSRNWVMSIGEQLPLHADFSADPSSGIPVTVVPQNVPPVPVRFEQGAAQSDPGPYPVPENPLIEGSGDRHILLLDQPRCRLYELFLASRDTHGGWKAYSGAVFRLDQSRLRPDGWTSADAAGLPITPGLVRYQEVAAGAIRHALRFTAPRTNRRYVWPARHFASQLSDPALPPMGQRFRLRASFPLDGFSAPVRVILQTLKTYGMMLADNGAAWYLSGAPDPGWRSVNLKEFARVRGSDFEAVDVSSLQIDPDSGTARQQRLP